MDEDKSTRMEKLPEQIRIKKLEQTRRCDTRQREVIIFRNIVRGTTTQRLWFNLNIKIDELKRMTIVRKALRILLRLASATNEYLHPDEYSKSGKHFVLLDHKIDSTVRILRYIDEHMAGSSLFAYEPPMMAIMVHDT